MSCVFLHAFYKLQTFRSNRFWLSSYSRHTSVAPRIVRKLWNRHFRCKRVTWLLRKGCCSSKVQEEGIEKCSIHGQGMKAKKQNRERKFFKQLYFRQQFNRQQIIRSGSEKTSSSHVFKRCDSGKTSYRHFFWFIPSWSRHIEESIGSEIADSTVSNGQDECTIDLSQLFLGQKLAHGAHSRLYHGIYQNQSVAVKLMLPPCNDLQLSPRLDQQFSQEVALLSQLRHSNIIEFVGACKKPPIYCVVTEYLPGGSLKAFLHKSEPNSLPMGLVRRMALHVARGMEYLHSQGVIHRDLKSDNILLTDDLHLKIADFGISCLETQKKIVKDFVGTYRWMAPEMIKEELPSRKVDVYSFGIVLWELCTGLIPFADMTPVQAAFAICQEKARPMIPSHCPKELAKLMQQCWCSNPVNRPEFYQIRKILEISTVF